MIHQHQIITNQQPTSYLLKAGTKKTLSIQYLMSGQPRNVT